MASHACEHPSCDIQRKSSDHPEVVHAAIIARLDEEGAAPSGPHRVPLYAERTVVRRLARDLDFTLERPYAPLVTVASIIATQSDRRALFLGQTIPPCTSAIPRLCVNANCPNFAVHPMTAFHQCPWAHCPHGTSCPAYSGSIQCSCGPCCSDPRCERSIYRALAFYVVRGMNAPQERIDNVGAPVPRAPAHPLSGLTFLILFDFLVAMINLPLVLTWYATGKYASAFPVNALVPLFSLLFLWRAGVPELFLAYAFFTYALAFLRPFYGGIPIRYVRAMNLASSVYILSFPAAWICAGRDA
jgi:hypothetical protein